MTHPSDSEPGTNPRPSQPPAARRRPDRAAAKGGARQNARSGRRSGGHTPPGGPRHLARILTMQVLYEVDVADHSATEVLARTFDDPALLGEDDAPDIDALADVRGRVERLVRGILETYREIDPYIAEAAPAFPVAQLPAVERNVLRLAIYELLRERDVPTKAAINEAVELAKRFGGDNSSRFVNGVLGTIAGRIDAEERRRQEGTDEPPSATGD